MRISNILFATEKKNIKTENIRSYVITLTLYFSFIHSLMHTYSDILCIRLHRKNSVYYIQDLTSTHLTDHSQTGTLSEAYL